MMRAHTVEPLGDPFHDILIGVVALVMAIFLLGSAVAFAAIYYGDDVAKPSWNERTTPLPRQYWPDGRPSHML